MSDLGANFRDDFSEATQLKKGVSKFNIAATIAIPLAAILVSGVRPTFLREAFLP